MRYIQAHGLGQPQPAGIDQFKQGAVAQFQYPGATHGHECGGLVHIQCLGQAPLRFGHTNIVYRAGGKRVQLLPMSEE